MRILKLFEHCNTYFCLFAASSGNTILIVEERGKGGCVQRVSGCVCIYMDSHILMKFQVFADGQISEVVAGFLTSVNDLLQLICI